MDFVDKMKDFLNKGVEASKSALNKVGDAVQDFGDKSVIKIEIKKLESRLEKQYQEIGKFVFKNTDKKNNFVFPEEKEPFVNMVNEIRTLTKEIEEKTKEYNSVSVEKK
ncbi:MAG: hypothetical protein ACTTHG_07770 [Treponemataceae bacterium]